MVQLKDIKKSNKYLGKSNRLISKIFLSAKEQFIKLEEEIEMLNLYLDLEKLRLGTAFKADLYCDIDTFKQTEIKLPTMFIQPYIENAIKQAPQSVKIQFSLKENFLACIIQNIDLENNKKTHFEEKRLHFHTVFTIESTKDRIQVLNNTLKRKIKLEVVNLFEEKKLIGTQTTLLFPV